MTKLHLFILKFFIIFAMLGSYSHAQESFQPFNLENLEAIADETLKVNITVLDVNATKPYTWQMPPYATAILYKKLKNLHNVAKVVHSLNIKNPESGYQGLKVQITNKYGEKLQPFVVYNGFIRYAENQKIIAQDTNRDLEYTLWGQNYSNKNQNMMWKMIPIISFNDCAKLGNRLVETSPRQCLLLNGDIFLDVAEQPTQEALSIQNFDDCLVKGQAIINTFPRRCIAAGGHVYTEPPRVR